MILHKSIRYARLLLTWIVIAVMTTACKDDDLFGDEEITDGYAMISMNLSFEQEARNLGSRSYTGPGDHQGGAPGNTIQNINSLCILVYDLDGNLYKKYYVTGNATSGAYNPDGDPDLSGNLTYQLEDNRTDDEIDTPFGNDLTGSARFNLKLPRGKYYIYAVANMGNLTTYKNQDVSSKILTRDGLKKIRFNWNQDDIAANSEMFGVFALSPDRGATDAVPLIVNKSAVSLHAWLRRAASKVTVAFDGSALENNVQIYIEDIRIMDIPKECVLGEDNVPGIKSGSEYYPTADRYTVANGLIDYRDADGSGTGIPANARIVVQDLPSDITGIVPDRYVHVCNDLHRYLGISDYGKSQDVHGETHKNTATSLFFYENMQGTGKDKRQDADADGVIDKPNPDESNPESGWKDNKPYGTYVEVRGSYRCTANNMHLGSGPILFRFMLGKNVTDDYNAERNTHYKLTLRFKGYGNDADWHIEYAEQPPSILLTTPQYISYLYDKSLSTSIKVLGLDNSEFKGRGLKLKAEILEADNTNGRMDPKGFSGWRPWGNDSETFPYPPSTGFYYTGSVYKDGPWNSFLSLYKAKVLNIMKSDWKDKPSYLWGNSVYDCVDLNKTYYEGKSGVYGDDSKIHKGVRFYEQQTVAGDDGYTFEKDADGAALFSIQLFTRAKELVTRTGYVGNNPYTGYPRMMRIRISIVDASGNVVPQFEPQIMDVIQVRRVLNPKGVWRSKDCNDAFNVTLMRLPKIDAASFEPFSSEGDWYAEVVGSSSSVITLETTPTGSGDYFSDSEHQISPTRIHGESEHKIDFKIKFTGNTGCAIVRVRYHNNSCEHDIFVRKGYEEPITLTNDNTPSNDNPAWYSYNVYAFKGNNSASDVPIMCNSPLEEGSMFRRTNNIAILATNNGRAGFGFNETPSGSFNVLVPATNGTTTATRTWTQLQPNSDTKRFEEWSIGPDNVRVATIADFNKLRSDSLDPVIKKAYGVLYGDGAIETATLVSDVYGYQRADGVSSSKGMRGCFVYNKQNYKQIFFPIGASGYGHRNHTNGGVLRYAGASTYITGTIDGRPLFYTLFQFPGAIYWCRNWTSTTNANNASAFDINFNTMGFEGYMNDAAPASGGSNSHAAFIRLVKYGNTDFK